MDLSFDTRCSLLLSSFIKIVKGLSEDQRNVIKRMGFGYLLEMHNQTLSKNLLLELMGRWCCEKKVFELRPGKVKISLMDVALILGLRVTGMSVFVEEHLPISDLEKDYGATIQKRCILVSNLEKRLESLKTVATEDFVRSFLLYTFGALLFPNGHGTVDTRYLSFLRNLDRVSEFAWGKAVREYLYEWMDKLKKEKTLQNMGSCLVFLQLWSFEHIDIARPSLLECSLTFPRASRWKNNSSRRRDWLSTKFEELQGDQIVWRLKVTPEESTIDIIRDLLEMRDETTELSSTSEYSTSDAADVDDDVRDETLALEEKVIELEDLEALIVEDSLELQEDETEILSTSRYTSKSNLQEDKMEILSTSKYASRNEEVKEDNMCIPSTSNYASIDEEMQEDNMEILSKSKYASRYEEVQEDDVEKLSTLQCVSAKEKVIELEDLELLIVEDSLELQENETEILSTSRYASKFKMQEDEMEILSTSKSASRSEEMKGENMCILSTSNYASTDEEVQEVNMEIQSKSKYASRNEVVQTDNVENLSTLQCVSANDSAGHEDRRALEEQIVKLKNENAVLREENSILRNRLLSSVNLVDCFERILLDENAL